MKRQAEADKKAAEAKRQAEADKKAAEAKRKAEAEKKLKQRKHVSCLKMVIKNGWYKLHWLLTKQMQML